jgi:hypothetical protein
MLGARGRKSSYQVRRTGVFDVPPDSGAPHRQSKPEGELRPLSAPGLDLTASVEAIKDASLQLPIIGCHPGLMTRS